MARRNLSFSTSVATSATQTSICIIPTGEAQGSNRMGLTITNTDGANPLDAFSVLAYTGKSTVGVVLSGGASGTTDDFTYTTVAAPTTTPNWPQPPIIRASKGEDGAGTVVPKTLAAGKILFLLIDTAGIDRIELKASAATAAIMVTVEATVN